jgi:hypothetical protein
LEKYRYLYNATESENAIYSTLAPVGRDNIVIPTIAFGTGAELFEVTATRSHKKE